MRPFVLIQKDQKIKPKFKSHRVEWWLQNWLASTEISAQKNVANFLKIGVGVTVFYAEIPKHPLPADANKADYDHDYDKD